MLQAHDSAVARFFVAKGFRHPRGLGTRGREEGQVADVPPRKVALFWPDSSAWHAKAWGLLMHQCTDF